jgi:hypothetical protein
MNQASKPDNAPLLGRGIWMVKLYGWLTIVNPLELVLTWGHGV